MRAAHPAARFLHRRTAIMSDKVDADFIRRLTEAVAAMPAEQREIFLAHRVDAMSYTEIARRRGITVRQVEQQMARAMYKLVKQMEGEPLSWWERWF
jgi:RNA polymerase sigma-70 factor (ECF subfamily)